ncbi:LysM domain-containing protein [Alkalispirillum mobile]|uniref:LysM domain-containing protein n=1 Tax=Alkalispirillum mobile TaxID=85925 RepID=A0A498BT69_9GAMM|nr:LysM domain-containing protein [Alkalispirillum mobile]RLK47153.1 LysM domain-containing protein [Alkalispirillum mobile]
MRTGKLIGLVALLLFSLSAVAGDLLRSDHPERYEVQRGDTLWDISARFLREPWNWPEIWQANPEIENPHLIFPGDVLRLTWVDGEPRLEVEDRVVRLSPEVRESPLEDAIPTIPMSAIRPFLSRSHILDDATLNEAPYVLTGREDRVLSAAGDNVYARGLGDEPAEAYNLVRRGDAIEDPKTGDTLGYEAIDLGDAELLRNGDPATLRVTRSTREVRAGDRLVEGVSTLQRAQLELGVPDDPDFAGQIVHVLDGVRQVGQFSVVVINRGADDGLSPGHVLRVFSATETARDPVTREVVELPEEDAGDMVIFRTMDNMAMGLIMEARRPMQVEDVVRRP